VNSTKLDLKTGNRYDFGKVIAYMRSACGVSALEDVANVCDPQGEFSLKAGFVKRVWTELCAIAGDSMSRFDEFAAISRSSWDQVDDTEFAALCVIGSESGPDNVKQHFIVDTISNSGVTVRIVAGILQWLGVNIVAERTLNRAVQSANIRSAADLLEPSTVPSRFRADVVLAVYQSVTYCIGRSSVLEAAPYECFVAALYVDLPTLITVLQASTPAVVRLGVQDCMTDKVNVLFGDSCAIILVSLARRFGSEILTVPARH
jgi:hypothetical protein